MIRISGKQKAQRRSAIETTAGMYGDLQGIADNMLQQTMGFEIRLLEDHKRELGETG